MSSHNRRLNKLESDLRELEREERKIELFAILEDDGTYTQRGRPLTEKDWDLMEQEARRAGIPIFIWDIPIPRSVLERDLTYARIHNKE